MLSEAQPDEYRKSTAEDYTFLSFSPDFGLLPGFARNKSSTPPRLSADEADHSAVAADATPRSASLGGSGGGQAIACRSRVGKMESARK